MREILGHFGSQSSSYRLWSGVSGMAIGAVAIPSGIVMTNRSDSMVAGPIALGIGIGSVVGGGLSLLIPSDPLERLHRSFEERAASGKPAAQIVAEMENEWRERVESERTMRRVIGGIGIGLGTAALGTGAFLALRKPPLGRLSTDEQYGFGAAFLGLGAVSVFTGLQAFILEDNLEASYSVYRRMKAPPAGPVASLPSFSFAPMPGGGFIGLHGTF